MRRFIHRLLAASLRRRIARDQLDLDSHVTMEQTRLHVLTARADWHERQGTRQAAPVPTTSRKTYVDIQLVRKEDAA
jgi:transposase